MISNNLKIKNRQLWSELLSYVKKKLVLIFLFDKSVPQNIATEIFTKLRHEVRANIRHILIYAKMVPHIL